jgi:hypothetical protein
MNPSIWPSKLKASSGRNQGLPTDSLVERVGLLFDRFVPDDNEYAMIEATIICTHQASAGAKGGAPKQERSDAAKADRAASSTRYAMRLANLSLSTWRKAISTTFMGQMPCCLRSSAALVPCSQTAV